MGIGSFIVLINATPWLWTKGPNHEYQMNNWDFPETIEPGRAERIYIEQQSYSGGDDAAVQTYGINDFAEEFEIYYRSSETPQIHVNFTNLATVNNPVDSSLQLEWTHDGASPFILASSPDNSADPPVIFSTNPPEDWMHAAYDRISCLPLRSLCVPGTHDSGMSEFHGGPGGPAGSGGATATNTQTQTMDIYDQMQNGARWFDLRPVIAGGEWTTGHYSFGAGSWHGGNGQSIESIIDQVNQFTATHNELLIFEFSHSHDTDNFAGDKDNHLTQDNWNDLLDKLDTINFRAENFGYFEDISILKVSDFIELGPKVIIIVDDVNSDGDPVALGGFANLGFFIRSQFPLFNEYSNTDDQGAMVADQLQKLRANRTSTDSPPFLLSWTLTQPWYKSSQSIINNAGGAGGINNGIYWDLWPVLTSDSYPNVLMIDAYPYVERSMPALAMAINAYLAPSCT